LPIGLIVLFTSPLVASGSQCYLGSYLFLREGGPYMGVIRISCGDFLPGYLELFGGA
jgi:hypothetical protein